MSYRKIILILFLGVFLSAERNAQAQVHTVTFNYTGSMQTFRVPSCVAYITIDCYGAEGIAVSNELTHAGHGGQARGVATVAPGQIYNIFVGGQAAWNGGGLGQNGANGGDASDVRYPATSLANRIIVAGGGGGAGGDNWQFFTPDTGDGGSGTPVGTNFVGGGGGQGYAGEGANGGATGGAGYSGNGCHGGGGGGGGMTTGGGGAYASCGPFTAPSGTLGNGGASYNAPGCAGEGAGGGGGGYYGGGGSVGANCGAGQGGGGSSWTGTLGSPFFSHNHLGAGEVIISYVTDSVGSASPNIMSGIICSGSNAASASILVNGAPGGGAFTYSWTPNGATTDTVTGLLAGVYTVTVTGCGSATTTVTITQPGFFAPAPVIGNILCNGGTGSITAGAIGGTLPYTYVFTPGGNVPAIYNLAAGTYSLNILDNRGCATSDLISLTQPNVLSTTTSMVTAPNCYGGNGGSLLANVNGGTYPFNYAWSPAGGTSAAASGLSGGTYTLTVTDNNGCTESVPATVSQPAYLGVVVNPPLFNLACNGDNNGVLGSGVEGGIRPYTYAWSGARGSDSDAMNLSAGTYSLTVTDAHGCVTVVSATVNQPPAMNLTIDSTLDNGSCTGSAWVILSGATPPYNYLWSNLSVAFYQNNLCKGEYCCRVTDANGCIYDKCTHVESDLGVGNVSGNSDKITVYPNPNNGTFTVASTVDGGNSVLEVYNVLGEKVYSSTLNASKGENNSINMGAQTNGIYLYRVMTVGGNLLGEGKIVLQK